ncbi:MAG TPA: hypothetical protein VMJ35_00610 [Dongiaceae bacterium]|nr:hypothetical protein [Dongiaceae bacterium]
MKIEIRGLEQRAPAKLKRLGSFASLRRTAFPFEDYDSEEKRGWTFDRQSAPFVQTARKGWGTLTHIGQGFNIDTNRGVQFPGKREGLNDRREILRFAQDDGCLCLGDRAGNGESRLGREDHAV